MKQASSNVMTVILCLSCSILAAGPAVDISCAAAQPKTRQPLDVALQDAVLTVDSQGVPLSDVLEAVSTVVGFDLKLRGEFHTATTVNLRAPVGEAVKQLVGRHSLLMRYGEADESGARRLIGVAVYQGADDVEPGVDASQASIRQRTADMEEPNGRAVKLPIASAQDIVGTGVDEGTGPGGDTAAPTPEEAYIEEVCSGDATLDKCAEAYEAASQYADSKSLPKSSYGRRMAK